jgi:hypothetical protein
MIGNYFLLGKGREGSQRKREFYDSIYNFACHNSIVVFPGYVSNVSLISDFSSKSGNVSLFFFCLNFPVFKIPQQLKSKEEIPPFHLDLINPNHQYPNL